MDAEIRQIKINILALLLVKAILENVVYEFANSELANPSPQNSMHLHC